jgi:hypothetical protein
MAGLIWLKLVKEKASSAISIKTLFTIELLVCKSV